MAYQAVFQRYELKYQLTEAQQRAILAGMAGRMEPDRHGRSTVRSIYLDTPDHRLIRRSLEKPVYKEKLRLRSYSLATPDSPVFLEIKKKYRGLVSKRRLALTEPQALDWLAGAPCLPAEQIARELDYARDFYGSLRPTVFLSYDREAWYDPGSDFRVTFDRNVRCRTDRLSLQEEPGGSLLLPEGLVLMELKCGGGLPLWMVRLLSEGGIRKNSFSKYGAGYQQLIHPQLVQGGTYHDGSIFQRTF